MQIRQGFNNGFSVMANNFLMGPTNLNFTNNNNNYSGDNENESSVLNNKRPSSTGGFV